MKNDRLRPSVLLALIMSCFSAAASAQDTIDSAYLEKFFGIYELSSGQSIYIQPYTDLRGKLLYSDDHGEVRGLSFVSDNVFSAGPGLFAFTPEEMRIAFTQDSLGKIISLALQQDGLPTKTAKKAEFYKQENVTFPSRDVTLAGLLLAPADEGPHAAVVLINGSGPLSRYDMLIYAQFLLRQGIMVLGFDKPGVGDSTGDWRQTGIEERADHVVAAVEFLKNRNDTDTDRIGVLGLSQGGWVGPLAASKSNDIAFVVSIGGPAVTPAEQELDRFEYDLRAKGFSEGEIAEAIALSRLRDDFIRGRRSWEEFLAAAEGARETRWIQYLLIPRSEDAWELDFWRRLPLDYNPTPVLERLRVPVLAVFGELDRIVLPRKNSAMWAEAFERSRNEITTIKILPRANHGLFDIQTGRRVSRIVPEYAPLLRDWLQRRGIAGG